MRFTSSVLSTLAATTAIFAVGTTAQRSVPCRCEYPGEDIYDLSDRDCCNDLVMVDGLVVLPPTHEDANCADVSFVCPGTEEATGGAPLWSFTCPINPEPINEASRNLRADGGQRRLQDSSESGSMVVLPADHPDCAKSPSGSSTPSSSPSISVGPSASPTPAPVTDSPTPIPVTESPTPLPVTDSPTPLPITDTTAQYTCGAFPDAIRDYFIVSEGDANLFMQNVNGGNKGILVGGDLDGGNFNFQNNGADFFVKGSVVGNFNQKQYVNSDGTLRDRVDFDYLKYLAKNAQRSNANGKEVLVESSGGIFPSNDFFNGGDCNNGNNKLVIFDTTEDVTITLADNQQLGYNILAPFAKLTISTGQNAGNICGLLIGKEVSSSGKQYQADKAFDGAVSCTTSDPVETVAPAPGIPEGEDCELPTDMGKNSPQGVYAKYSLITKGNAIVGAHNVYSAIAVGGELKQAGSSQTQKPSLAISSNTPNDDDSYAGSVDPNNSFQFGTAQLQVTSNALEAAGVNFAAYEQLTMNAVPSTTTNNGDTYRVYVINQDTDTDQKYTLYDFVPGGQGEDNGKTIVFFQGTKTITLTKTNDGRQFGPSVVAPFAQVNLWHKVGFIDGFIVAKSFKATGSNPGTPQMHGNAFQGDLQCVAS